MRLTITPQDLPVLKKAAKILRRNWPTKLGQQKALNIVSQLLGYQDFFHLTREQAVDAERSSERLTLDEQVQTQLLANGVDTDVTETLINNLPWNHLSTFKTRAQSKRLFIDEFSTHLHSNYQNTGSDIVDLLSSLQMPRFSWWAPKQVDDIHAASVVILSKAIPLIRQVKEDMGWGSFDLNDESKVEELKYRITSDVFPKAMISALDVVTDGTVHARPFGFEVREASMNSSPCWLIHHPDTFSFLPAVFAQEHDAQVAMATIAATGAQPKHADEKTMHGVASLTLGNREIKVRVEEGIIINAIDQNAGMPDTKPHHTLSSLGFTLIQYRNLDVNPLSKNALLDPSARLEPDDKESYDYLIIPESPIEVQCAASQQTLDLLRNYQLRYQSQLRNATNVLANEIPTFAIDWLCQQLIPGNYSPSDEYEYEIEPSEMAEHVPQLTKEFPSQLLDDWYYSYVSDTQMCRPFGHTVGEPWEFVGYLAYKALTHSEPRNQQDTEVGLILLYLGLKNGQIDQDLLNKHRIALEADLKTLETWRSDVNQVKYGLKGMMPEGGVVSHGDKQTTLTDSFRASRKWNAGPIMAQQSISDIKTALYKP